MLDLIHLTNMETSLKTQYQNSSNISARIRLHSLYSKNKQGWFPWVFEQCKLEEGIKVLEIGCGNAGLWIENEEGIPKNIQVILSDISEGMIREIRRSELSKDGRFSFQAFDCHEIPFDADTFDLVIANHMLFYCEDIQKVCKEVNRVLKKGGHFLCSTYGAEHMKEISELVQEFDDRIALSADRLYERFGKENGAELLAPYFHNVKWNLYEDALEVDAPEPLIEYILSCHGNQNQYILERYHKFQQFVCRKLGKTFRITKEAGVFIGQK